MKTTTQNLQVLYEDNHLIAINKRAGDIVQGDKTGDIPLSEIVKAYLVEKYHKAGEAYLGVVHRLDRPTTGLVLFAKTSKALPRLNAAFATKEEVCKQYWALIEKKPIPTEGTLTHFLVRNTSQNKSYAYQAEKPQSQKAVLTYKVLATLTHYLLVEINLLTGREISSMELSEAIPTEVSACMHVLLHYFTLSKKNLLALPLPYLKPLPNL